MFPVRLWHLIGEPPARVALRVGLAGLLAGAVLALATPARAQNQIRIWNATLTPAKISSDSDFSLDYGCSNNSAKYCSDTSILSDDDFTYGSSAYRVTGLGIYAVLGPSVLLQLRFNRTLTPAMDGLTLVVGDKSFALATATRSSGHVRSWSNSGLSWTVDTPVMVSLTGVNTPPAFPANTAARSVAENTAAYQDVGAVLTATDAEGDTLTYTLEGADAAFFNVVTIAGAAQIRTRPGVTYNHEARSTYTVTVKADDSHGGTDTVMVTITVTDVNEPPGRPAAPTVSGTAGSSTSLDVTWTAPANTGPAITTYDLQYREGAGGSFIDGPQHVTGTSAAIGGLMPTTSYDVQVRATNAEGDGDWSFSGTGQTTDSESPPPPPPPVTGGGGGGGGQPAAAPVGSLENPGVASPQSGIGVLSGWVCEADEVEIELGELGRQAAGYGTERLDTAETCGDTDNGFGLLFNWNRLDDGEHAVVAYVDGVELSRTTVTVTTLGEEFVRGVEGECVVEDFPSPGEMVSLAWQQTSQNFVIVDGPAPSGASRGGVAGVGYLENPGSNAFQSGIGVISGWVCDAEEIEVEIGHLGRQVAAYGTERLDTQEACGDTDNGFGLLFNWNRLGEGAHAVVVYRDGEELGRATVRVTTLGEEFVRGAAGECLVEDFPMPGETVTLEWQQNQQNFVITAVE